MLVQDRCFYEQIFKASFQKKEGKRKYKDGFLSVRTIFGFRMLLQIQNLNPDFPIKRTTCFYCKKNQLILGSGTVFQVGKKRQRKPRMKSTLLWLSNYIFLIFSCVFLIVFLIVCPFFPVQHMF